MAIKRSSSSKPPADLIRLFAERSGCDDLDGIQAIRDHVAQLRHTVNAPQVCADLQIFLTARRIDQPELVPDLRCDGYLEPKGRSYEAGFRMVLRDRGNRPRMRFTMAHEICHSFFYELVPELKFSPHDTDPDEERICNAGAAELLMPLDHLVRKASGSGESVGALVDLASEYGVSLDAMMVRLRRIVKWKSELTIWHGMTNGTFVMERICGAKSINWRWSDEAIIRRAWESSVRHSISGRTAIEFEDASGNEFAQIVYFQMKRHGDSVIALWSKRRLAKPDTPLFQKSAGRVSNTVGSTAGK